MTWGLFGESNEEVNSADWRRFFFGDESFRVSVYFRGI